MHPKQIVIQKVVLDLELPDSAPVHPFLNGLKRILQDRIIALLEKEIAVFSPKTALLQIEQIHINFSYDHFEELIDQMIKAIQQQTADQIKQLSIPKEYSSKQLYQLIYQYLFTGNLPNWYLADDETPLDLKEKIQFLRAQSQELFNKLVNAASQFTFSSNRLEHLGVKTGATHKPKNLIELIHSHALPPLLVRQLWEDHLTQLTRQKKSKELSAIFHDKNIYDITTIPILKSIWNRLLITEKQQLQIMMDDLIVMMRKHPFITPGQAEKAFYIATIKYKLHSTLPAFQVDELLSHLFEELSFLKQWSPAQVGEKLSHSLQFDTNPPHYKSALADLILQYAPATIKEDALKSVAELSSPATRIKSFLNQHQLDPTLDVHALNIALGSLFHQYPDHIATIASTIFNSPQYILTRVLEFAELTFIDQLIAAHIKLSTTQTNALLKDLEQLFVLELLPERDFSRYQKIIRQQMIHLHHLSSDEYTDYLKLAWIKICNYYDTDYQETLIPLPSNQFNKRLRKYWKILRTQIPDTTIKNTLEWIHNTRILILDAPKHLVISGTHTAASQLFFELVHQKKPWWITPYPQTISAPADIAQKLTAITQAAQLWISHISPIDTLQLLTIKKPPTKKVNTIQLLISERPKQHDRKKISGKKISRKEVSGEAISRQEVGGKEISGEETSEKEISGKKISREAISRQEIGKKEIGGKKSPSRQAQAQQLEVISEVLFPAHAQVSSYSIKEALLLIDYYFINGRLPLPVAHFKKVDFERFIELQIKRSPRLVRSYFLNLFKSKSWSVEAFRLLSPKSLTGIIALMYQQPKTVISRYWKDFVKIRQEQNKKATRRTIDKQLVDRWLNHLSNHGEAPFSDIQLILFFLEEVQDRDEVSPAQWLARLYRSWQQKGMTFQSDLLPQLSTHLHKHKEITTPTDDQLSPKTITDTLIHSLKEAFITQDQEAIFINNAGLAIIALWLPEYFRRLNLLENKVFINEKAQDRAVHLLQYLASGRSHTPEYLLHLNKIICGLSPMDMVSDGIQMTAQEEETSEQLLQAIISNWSAIGNTSIDGLRGNFIIRDGKLENEEEYWSLRVESRAYDILLKSLPWGMSIINLPWMEKRIQVEWN